MRWQSPGVQGPTDTQKTSRGIQTWHIAVFIFACSAYLALVGLDHAYFWDDEAEVGIIAKNLLSTGKLMAWDGRNLFAYHLGTTLDPNLRPINPPLQYIVAAASFKVLGVSTWAGRFPFVLFGLASLALFAWIVHEEFRERDALWLYAMGVFGLSLEFLLNVRQCRYYAPALFFTLLTYYFYRRSLRNRRAVDFVLLGVAAALLFYSHYLLCAAFLASFVVVHFVFYRRVLAGRDWLQLMFSVVVFALLTVPYAVRYRVWVRPDVEKTTNWLSQKITFFWWNFRELNTLNCFPWMLAVGVLCLIVRERKNEWFRRTIWPWLALGIGYIFFLALRTELAETQEAPMRYFLPAIPFFAVAIATLLWFIHERQRCIALALFGVFISTNLFSLAPKNSVFRGLLTGYVKEIHRPFPTSYRAAAEYLNTNAKPDANVVCFPEFCTYPLMFYCGDKLRFGCVLDTREAVAAQKYFSMDLLDSLKGPLFLDEHFPDYFVAFGRQQDTVNLLKYFSRPHEDGPRLIQYDYHPLNRLNVFWYDTSRPELPRHTFGPKTDFDAENESVFVFERSSAKRLR